MAANYDEGDLYYGMILTRIFEEFPINLNQEMKGARSQNFDSTTIRKMGLHEADESDDEFQEMFAGRARRDPEEDIIGRRARERRAREEQRNAQRGGVQAEGHVTEEERPQERESVPRRPYIDIDFDMDRDTQGYDDISPTLPHYQEGIPRTHVPPPPPPQDTGFSSYFESMERLINQRFDVLQEDSRQRHQEIEQQHREMERQHLEMREESRRQHQELRGDIQALRVRMGRLETFFEGRVPAAPTPPQAGSGMFFQRRPQEP